MASADGVAFINDSKATNLGATIAALEGIPANNQVILIAGGDAKGVDLQPLARVLVDRVRHMVTLGQDGPLLAQVARSAGVPTTPVKYIEDAVVFGAQLARGGDMVLLSPACASLDMFANYAQRGDAFAQAARELCAQRGVR